MREWCAGSRRGMSCGRRHKMRLLQHRMDHQLRENQVQLCVIVTLRARASSSALRVCVAGNVCVCDHGVAATGAKCPVHGSAKCVSCNVGWTMNVARTDCTRKCARVRVQCRMRKHAVIVRSFALYFHSECVHMRQRCGANRSGLSGERRFEVRVMQHRVADQRR